MRRLCLVPAVIFSTFASMAQAEIRLEGFFVAQDACPALQSIRKGTNPGNVALENGRAYELLAANRDTPSHYLVRVPNAEPDRRWVAVGCGVRMVVADGEPGPAPTPGDTPTPGGPETLDHVLAISWQPGFCETRPAKPECATQTEDRFDASNFSLHGLWPQPRRNVYCQVSPGDAEADKAGRWDMLPEVPLEQALRKELDIVMPGTASFLERHEWTKHGTCYGETMEEYFADSLFLMRAINASGVRALFASHIGRELTSAEIREAFDEAFGPGAGSRVRVSCSDDPSGGRRLIGELTIGLSGEIDASSSLGDLMFAAAPTSDAGCPRGIVDAAGFQ